MSKYKQRQTNLQVRSTGNHRHAIQRQEHNSVEIDNKKHKPNQRQHDTTTTRTIHSRLHPDPAAHPFRRCAQC